MTTWQDIAKRDSEFANGTGTTHGVWNLRYWPRDGNPALDAGTAFNGRVFQQDDADRGMVMTGTRESVDLTIVTPVSQLAEAERKGWIKWNDVLYKVEGTSNDDINLVISVGRVQQIAVQPGFASMTEKKRG